MRSYMFEVAETLGVRVGERFEIDTLEGVFTLYGEGLYSMATQSMRPDVLFDLLTGKLGIKRKPWKPKANERYYVIQETGLVSEEEWWDECIDQVDVVVTDSPIALSIIYNNGLRLVASFNNMVLETFNSYNNWNYLLARTKPYNPIGRNQTEAESDNIGKDIEKMLCDNCIPYKQVDGDIFGYGIIISDVLNAIKGVKGVESDNG